MTEEERVCLRREVKHVGKEIAAVGKALSVKGLDAATREELKGRAEKLHERMTVLKAELKAANIARGETLREEAEQRRENRKIRAYNWAYTRKMQAIYERKCKREALDKVETYNRERLGEGMEVQKQ